MTWDRRLYFPSEGRRAEGFYFSPWKFQWLRLGLNPANLCTKGQHATCRPPKPLSSILILYFHLFLILSSGLFPLGFSIRTLHAVVFSHINARASPKSPFLFRHPNNVLCGVPFVNLVFMQFPPFCSHCHPHKPKYPLQHPLLKYSRPW